MVAKWPQRWCCPLNESIYIHWHEPTYTRKMRTGKAVTLDDFAQTVCCGGWCTDRRPELSVLQSAVVDGTLHYRWVRSLTWLRVDHHFIIHVSQAARTSNWWVLIRSVINGPLLTIEQLLRTPKLKLGHVWPRHRTSTTAALTMMTADNDAPWDGRISHIDQ